VATIGTARPKASGRK